MAKFTFSFKRLIMVVIDPLLRSLSNIHIEMEKTMDNRFLYLTKDVSGGGKIIGKGIEEVVEIRTDVDPTGHVHDAEQLPVSVQPPIKNTLAKRDAGGNVFSEDTSNTDTGYKLVDGTDIISLFKTTSEPYMNISNNVSVQRDGFGYTFLSNAWIDKPNGNTLRLNATLSANCIFWDLCRCECCD